MFSFFCVHCNRKLHSRLDLPTSASVHNTRLAIIVITIMTTMVMMIIIMIHDFSVDVIVAFVR